MRKADVEFSIKIRGMLWGKKVNYGLFTSILLMLTAEHVCKFETVDAVWSRLSSLSEMIYGRLKFIVSGQEQHFLCDWYKYFFMTVLLLVSSFLHHYSIFSRNNFFTSWAIKEAVIIDCLWCFWHLTHVISNPSHKPAKLALFPCYPEGAEVQKD